MLPIVWAPQAAADIASLPDPARQRIFARLALIAEFPSMGAAMDGPYEGFRQIVSGRYRVICEHAEEQIRIAYVRHGARQPGLRLVRGGK